jgi:serine/threonine protein kinase
MNRCPHCDSTHDNTYLFCPVSGQPIVAGQYLEERLAVTGQLPVKEAIRITRDILIAVDAVHRAGLLKLNLSPATVFLAQSDTGDIVKLVTTANSHQETESQAYCAPEQFDTSRQPNPRSDIYAVGANLYKMLTGKVPEGAVEPLRSFRKDISPDLVHITEKSLSVAIKDRYQTALDFVNALDALGAISVNGRPQGSDPTLNEENSTSLSATADETYELEPQTELATIIVNMPSMERYLPVLYSTGFRVGAAVVAVLTIAAIVFPYSEVFNSTDKREKVDITVNIEPSDAVIAIDGRRYDANPLTLNVEPDNTLHTIQANAEGFEQLERDIKFDKTKTVILVLIEAMDPVPEPQVETFTLQDEAAEQKEHQGIDGEHAESEIPVAPEPLSAKEIKSLGKEPLP